MTNCPHIAVIGAGIVGASIAWHLARAGAVVTVLEAGEPGGVATAASFAWINASWSNPALYVRLRLRGMAEWRRLAAEVPDLTVAWCGGLCWDLPPAELREFVRRRAARDYPLTPVGPAEIAAIEPALADPPELAVHAAAEGAVEPVHAALALSRDAQARGARLRRGTRVLGLRQRGGRVVGVETSEGFTPADEVVVAAGAGTPELLATAEVGWRRRLACSRIRGHVRRCCAASCSPRSCTCARPRRAGSRSGPTSAVPIPGRTRRPPRAACCSRPERCCAVRPAWS